MPGPMSQLQHLANLYGIKTSYLDVNNNIMNASREALLTTLQAMGAALSSIKDVPSALREKRRQDWQKVLGPVTVAWDNQELLLHLRLPAASIPANLRAVLEMEEGEEQTLDWRVEESSIIAAALIEGERFVSVRLYLPGKLPVGYHRLRFYLPGQEVETLIISAPLKAYIRPPGEKVWGVFLPLYALHSRRSWGAGDLTDLANLVGWVGKAGGKMVGTLPLLPSFFDKEKGPGPYLPASRLFWNEFYLDVEKIPELEQCPAARELVCSENYRREISSLGNSRSVDYPSQLFLKRKIIEILLEDLIAKKGQRFEGFSRFVESNPGAGDYAAFRAAGEANGINWHKWPKSLQKGRLKNTDYVEFIRQYYLYTQWLVGEQMQAMRPTSAGDGVFLYTDLPVGVHPYSYDIWRNPEMFVQGVNGGAPPDPVFTNGQNWSFPPLHPEKIRSQGYRYIIDGLRHQLAVAGMLRIDHIMNFHRLFWIPEGLENRDGLYVSYRAEELYAILTLESCRHKALIVGEDLGMVPPEVRPMMEKHGIYRMYIGQYDLVAEGQIGQVPAHCIASLNTHDMFPFAAFWQETDITERLKLKLIDDRQAQAEMEQRRVIKRSLISILQYRGLNNEIAQDTLATLKAVLGMLAAGPAYAVLVNLEDLWLETHPQNIPGLNRPQNWSRKTRYLFENFVKLTQVEDILSCIARERRT